MISCQMCPHEMRLSVRAERRGEGAGRNVMQVNQALDAEFPEGR
jgi:hypothetical protein